MPAIIRKTLTKAMLDAAKARPKAYRLWDAKVPGLCVRVLPSGVRSFTVTWPTGSKAIGKYPAVTLDAARDQAQVILSDAARNGTPDVAKKKGANTLGDFIDKRYEPWVTVNRKSAVATLARLRSTFKGMLKRNLVDINAWVVEKWRTERLKGGISPATTNRDLNSLRAVLSKAVEWELIDIHPMRKVKASKLDAQGRVRWLTPDESKRLRRALAEREGNIRARRRSGNAWRAERGRDLMPEIPVDGYADHLMPLVLLALNTGCRRGELLALTWKQVDFEHRRMTVYGLDAKSANTRFIPLNEEAFDVLARYQRQQPGPRLFNVKRFDKAFDPVIAAAKIDDFTFHDCRHDFASWLVMGGVDLNTVRELLGHADIKQTLRYAHLAPEHKASAVAVLDATRTKHKVGQVRAHA